MTDKLHCANFHAFDGQCCDKDQDCLCDRPARPQQRPVPTISLLDVILAAMGFWIGVGVLAYIAFG